MKNYYVIKDDGFSKMYTSTEFYSVQQYMKENPTALMKGFYYIEDAQNFLKKKNPLFYYVIKSPNFSQMCIGKKNAIQIKEKEENREIILKTRDIEIAKYVNSISYDRYKEEREERNREKEERKKLQRKRNRKLNKKIKNINFDDNYIAFMDVEANKSKAISIGLVIYNTKKKEIVNQYYSLIKPNDFEYLDYHIERITKLSTKEINSAPPIENVSKDIINIIKEYGINYIFTWGRDDKRYIDNHNSILTREFSNKIFNIQPIICDITKETYHNQSMSLANMKQLYHLDTEVVTHNALNDTIDLTNVFKVWREKRTIDYTTIFKQELK